MLNILYGMPEPVLSGCQWIPGDMKAKRKKVQPLRTEQELNDALNQAMKQPGINVVMEVVAFAEKQLSAFAPYTSYVDWSKSSVVSTACHTTALP